MLLTRDAKLARTPGSDEQPVKSALSVDFVFDKAGNLHGQTERRLSEVEEIDLRGYFADQPAEPGAGRSVDHVRLRHRRQRRGGDEQRSAGSQKQFGYRFRFKADDYVDFGVVGGMTLPNPPGGKSFRTLYTTTAAPGNETPFYCSAQRYDETYRLQLPANVPIIAIPQDRQFRNAAGDYRVAWRRDGQQVIVNHQLQVNAIRGKEALCQAQDYPAFRELFQQVRRGFRGQVVYGELATGK